MAFGSWSRISLNSCIRKASTFANAKLFRGVDKRISFWPFLKVFGLILKYISDWKIKLKWFFPCPMTMVFVNESSVKALLINTSRQSFGTICLTHSISRFFLSLPNLTLALLASGFPLVEQISGTIFWIISCVPVW